MTNETCTHGAVEAQLRDGSCPYYAFRPRNETAMEGDCRCYASCEAVGAQENYVPGDPWAPMAEEGSAATTTTVAPEGESDGKGRPKRRLWLALGLVALLVLVVGSLSIACGCWCYFRRRGGKKAANPNVADVVYGSPVNEGTVPAANTVHQAVVAGSPIDPDDKEGMRSAAVVNLV